MLFYHGKMADIFISCGNDCGDDEECRGEDEKFNDVGHFKCTVG